MTASWKYAKFMVRRSLRPMRGDVGRLREIWELRAEKGYKNVRLYWDGHPFARGGE